MYVKGLKSKVIKFKTNSKQATKVDMASTFSNMCSNRFQPNSIQNIIKFEAF